MKEADKPKIRFIRTTVIGGLLFLVPLVALIIILAKSVEFGQKFVAPLTDRLPFESLIGLETPVLGAILFVILLCFLFGLYARTPLAKNSVRKVEEMILSKVPGYDLVKGMSESLVGLEGSDAYPVVILTLDDVGQIALLIEEGDDGLMTVFVPDSPSPMAGGVFFVKPEVLTRVDVSLPEAMQCLKKFGAGSAELRKLAGGTSKADAKDS